MMNKEEKLEHTLKLMCMTGLSDQDLAEVISGTVEDVRKLSSGEMEADNATLMALSAYIVLSGKKIARIE